VVAVLLPGLVIVVLLHGIAHFGRRGKGTTPCASSQVPWTQWEDFMQSMNKSQQFRKPMVADRLQGASAIIWATPRF
jgi:hypothetical protein